MSDLLLELYQLAQNTKKTPKEDFLSQCLAHYLQESVGCATGFAGALAKAKGLQPAIGAMLAAWAEAKPEEREIDVTAQYPVAYPEGGWGWIDVLIDLRLRADTPRDLRIVVEAKVGPDAPTDAQVEPYRAATAADVVVALVREGVACELDGVATLTWDDVWVAAAEHCRAFAELLAASGEVATWAIVPPKALAAAQRLTRSDAERVRVVAGALLPWLFSVPGTDVWARIVKWRDKAEAAGGPTVGEGVGFWSGQVIKGTLLHGATLAVVPSSTGAALVWRVEVLPSREGRARLVRRQDQRWEVVRAYPEWLATDLLRVSGDDTLTEELLVEVARRGRAALAPVRLGHNLGPPAFAADLVTGLKPSELAAGIGRIDAVEAILKQALRRAAERGASKFKDVSIAAYVRRVTVKKGQRAVRLEFDTLLASLIVEDLAERDGVRARWERRIAENTGLRVSLDADSTRALIPLDVDTWKRGLDIEAMLASLVTDALEK